MSRFLLSTLLLLAVIAISAVHGEISVTSEPSSVASSGMGKLLAHKQLDYLPTMPFNFARDAPINVTLTLINIGDAPAFDVVLQDSWSAGFELSGSSGTQKWDEIGAGQQVSISYFVTPTSDMPFVAQPARVSYQAKENGPVVTGYSTSRTNLNVIPADQFAKLTNTHVVEWSLFSGLFALFVIAPAFKWYEISSSYVKSGRRKAE